MTAVTAVRAAGAAPGEQARPAISRRGILAALGVWLGIHLAVALLHLDDTVLPGVSALAVGVWLAGTAVAVAPLSGRWELFLSRRLAWALAAVPPAVAALQMTVLTSAALHGFANWWPGAVGPLLAALAMRRRGGVATASAATAAAVLAASLLAHSLSPDRALVSTLVLGEPLLLWTAGGVAVRRLLDRSTLSVARLADAEASSRGRESDALARATAGESRRAHLQRTAVPVLERVRAAGAAGTVDDELRRRCEEVGLLLRDELGAPSLVDDEVRTAVAAARRRGCQVSLVDDAGPGAEPTLPAAVRELVVAAAATLPSGSLTVRRPPDDGVVVTLVVEGDQHAAADVANALESVVARHRLHRLEVECVFDSDASEVFAQLHAGPSAGAGSDGVPGRGDGAPVDRQLAQPPA